MPLSPSFTALLLGGLLLSACGDRPPEETGASDTDLGATAGLACYVRTSLGEARERPSPLRETRFTVGGSDALLCYGAPSARGRQIMGGLVAYGQPERIGANEPTTLHLSGPATIGGVSVGRGSYSLYAIPGETEWTFFVNGSWERWGIPIDAEVRAADVGSFTVTPEEMSDFVETLRYRFEGGEILLEWENTRLRIPVG